MEEGGRREKEGGKMLFIFKDVRISRIFCIFAGCKDRITL
jgi:hypothetical protein